MSEGQLTRIVVYVKGGVVQDVRDIPLGFEVEVRDYDNSPDADHLKLDEDGDPYYSDLWVCELQE